MFDDEDDGPLPTLREVLPNHEGFDKNRWGDGPWQQEPDRAEWIHRGVPCLMLRDPRFGNWRAYAGAEPGHKWHGNKLAQDECEAHGGITWCGVNPDMRLLSRPGEFENVWWIGFDCAHAFDLVPGLRLPESPEHQALLAQLGPPPEDMRDVYRDQQYVATCTNNVADQIIAARRQ